MRIIGIDPGLNKTGWGIIEYTRNNNSIKYIASGVLQTNPSDPMAYRLHQLSSELENILTLHNPKTAGLE